MDEDRFRRFQAIMKVITAVGAVVVFFLGLHRWYVEQAALIETRIAAEQLARDREFRRELWLRQVDTLSAIADQASLIAALADNPETSEFEAAVRDFERLYWGNVSFVDEQALMQAMDKLRQELRLYGEGLRPLDGVSPQDRVKQSAYGVAVACRNAVRQSGRNFINLDGIGVELE